MFFSIFTRERERYQIEIFSIAQDLSEYFVCTTTVLIHSSTISYLLTLFLHGYTGMELTISPDSQMGWEFTIDRPVVALPQA